MFRRGVGRSIIPGALSEYSTTAMCGDTLELLDTLGWRRAHVVGMSMGGASRPSRSASQCVRTLNPPMRWSRVPGPRGLQTGFRGF